MAKLGRTINVRVDEETYKEIKALAEGEGLSLSAWVRSLVEAELVRNRESWWARLDHVEAEAPA